VLAAARRLALGICVFCGVVGFSDVFVAGAGASQVVAVPRHVVASCAFVRIYVHLSDVFPRMCSLGCVPESLLGPGFRSFCLSAGQGNAYPTMPWCAITHGRKKMGVGFRSFCLSAWFQIFLSLRRPRQCLGAVALMVAKMGVSSRFCWEVAVPDRPFLCYTLGAHRSG